MEKSAAMRDRVQEEGVVGEGADADDDDDARRVYMVVPHELGSRWGGGSSTTTSRSSVAIVAATLIEMNAPAKFNNADIAASVRRGESAFACCGAARTSAILD